MCYSNETRTADWYGQVWKIDGGFQNFVRNDDGMYI